MENHFYYQYRSLNVVRLSVIYSTRRSYGTKKMPVSKCATHQLFLRNNNAFLLQVQSEQLVGSIQTVKYP